MEETPKRTRTILPPSVKKKIQAMWESGEYTAPNIAQELKLDPEVVRNFISNSGIEKGKRAEEIQRSAMSKAKQVAEEEATMVAARIRETKEEHYKMAMGLAKLTWREVVACREQGKEFGLARENLKALEIASNTLSKCRMERWAVLGLDKDDKSADNLPELVLTELTAEQIEQIRNFQEEDSLEVPDEELNRQFAQQNDDIIEEGEEE